MNSLKNSCINYDGKTLHEIFHENTALSKENIGVFSHYIGTAMESGNVKMIKDYKNFSNYERIDISNYCNRDIDEVKLVDVLLNRRSCRSFNGDSIPFNDFATILKYSCCASYKKDEFCFALHILQLCVKKLRLSSRGRLPEGDFRRSRYFRFVSSYF